jgi:CheY-like chemotaxis protein
LHALAFSIQTSDEWIVVSEGAVELDQARRGRVLLIDDEAFIISALRRLLGSEHDVTSTVNVRDAIALIVAGHRFDAILCDLRMPGMSGIDFYEKVRVEAPEMTDRIIFCTGASFSSDTREFFDSVPNRILEKPFDPTTVRSLVRHFVNEAAFIASV